MGAIVRRSDKQAIARRKGTLAATAAIGSTVVIVATSVPVVGVLGLAGAAYLGWNWLSYRMKHGLRL